MTVDTFSSADMENTNALKLSDMADYIPGFEAGAGVTQSALTIRGIHSPSICAGGDPSVAVFYDDAYVPSPATSMSFADISRYLDTNNIFDSDIGYHELQVNFSGDRMTR